MSISQSSVMSMSISQSTKMSMSISHFVGGCLREESLNWGKGPSGWLSFEKSKVEHGKNEDFVPSENANGGETCSVVRISRIGWFSVELVWFGFAGQPASKAAGGTSEG